ncbi:hypothetical protein PROFUN_15233 [Planoprotostelium fungivorum]|uniref:Uncharacterized protein n=1 Tax=Planoprotostelium fungivorum TaxID=1890364 RepID=A0A2P6MXG8_9EUKA|nr:hypothetical protein PROFUN_15233 [Planoprotostelium fungivorum]
MEVSKDYNLLGNGIFLLLVHLLQNSSTEKLLGMDDIPHSSPAWGWPPPVKLLWEAAVQEHTSEDPKDQAPIENIRRICREILDDLFSIGTFVQVPEIFVSDDITMVITWSKKDQDVYVHVTRIEDTIELSTEGKDYTEDQTKVVIGILQQRLLEIGCAWFPENSLRK